MNRVAKNITIPVPMNASGDKAITPRQWRFYADVEEAQGSLANARLMRSVADVLDESCSDHQDCAANPAHCARHECCGGA